MLDGGFVNVAGLAAGTVIVLEIVSGWLQTLVVLVSVYTRAHGAAPLVSEMVDVTVPESRQNPDPPLE